MTKYDQRNKGTSMVAMVEQEQAVEGGVVAGILWQSADTGWAVIRIERPDEFSEFTATGVMPDASVGLEVEMMGVWRFNPKYKKKQFEFTSYQVPQPTTKEGSVSFLATLKGVGPKVAAEMWDTFGEQVFSVLEANDDQLLQVRGIANKKLPKILLSYHRSKDLRKLISFLADVGVSASYAKRIYKEYGNDSITQIKRNPYILAEEVRGFGFKKADEVARGMGIAPDAAIRIEAGILHTLKNAATQKGHCFLPSDRLASDTCEVLLLPGYRPQIEDVLAVVESLRSSRTSIKKRLVVERDRVFLSTYYDAEDRLAYSIRQLSGEFQSNLVLDANIEQWLDAYSDRTGMRLAKGQRDAVIMANRFGVSVLTGGPGSGKTSVSRVVVASWHERKKRIIGCSPTGRAAKRLKESTGINTVSTIHRLLGWNGHGFEHNADNPLDADAFLIDEASMMDVRLASALFDAIPRHAIALIVGDVDQLPSVGAGNVLRDIIDSGQIPVTRLTEVFRQAATSQIIQASQSVNSGKFPEMEQIGKLSGDPYSDMLWLRCSRDTIPKAISWLCSERLLELGWQIDDIQLLSPMRVSETGYEAMNTLLQDAWNPKTRGKATYNEFRVGDRVIQTRNDYDKNVFNGDIGKIVKINTTDKDCTIWYPDIDNPAGREVVYDLDNSDMDDVRLAFAISIHKSQGSEFPVVVIPCSMSHSVMLQRNLYYTGVTRGKKLVILVGEERAIATAVKNYKVNQRNTALVERLTA